MQPSKLALLGAAVLLTGLAGAALVAVPAAGGQGGDLTLMPGVAGAWDDPTPTVVVTEEWETICIFQREVNSGAVRCVSEVTPTPSPVLPAATATPTSTPSPTVTPSPLPSANPTATPTNTSTPWPTATPEETALPPVTPGVDKLCAFKVGAEAINKRLGPGVTQGWYGRADPGTMVEVWEFTSADGYLWAHLVADGGWMAVKPLDGEWWVHGLENSELCQDLSGWPAGLIPPAVFVWDIPWPNDDLDGWHAWCTASWERLKPVVPYLGSLKVLDCSADLVARAKVVNPQIVTFLRVTRFGDCPPESYWPRPDAWINLQVPYWEPYRDVIDYVELWNECQGGPAVDPGWTIDAVRYANSQGYAVAIGSWAVANPTFEIWDAWAPPVIRALMTRPVKTWPDGSPQYNVLASHTYSLCESWDNIWITLGFEARLARLPADVRDAPYVYTEHGLHYCDESDPARAEDIEWVVNWYRVTYRYRNMRALMLWNLGPPIVPGVGWIDYGPVLAALIGVFAAG